MSQGSGTSAYTKNGNNLTWFGKTIPYCVSGATLTLDLAAVYSAEAIPPGTPFLATFAKK